MISMLFLRTAGGRGWLRCCWSSSSVNWSRSVVTGILLCLVALENALLAADRLQFLVDQRDELEQLANVEPRVVFEMKPGGRLLSHPDGNVETLAARGLQVVGRGWSLTALPDPQRLAGEGMKWVVDPGASIIRILL